MNPYEAPRENPSAAPTMAACAEVMVSLGATPREAEPWLYRRLWKMGCEARPPLYAGLTQRLVLQALPFAAIWTASMYFMFWRHFPAIAIVASFLMMALISILTDTWASNRTRKSKQLPDWTEIQALAAGRIRS